MMRPTFSLLLTATLVATITSFGCKTSTPPPDKELAEQPSSRDPIDMDSSSAGFADSPCGSADWSKLPNGMDPAKAEARE